MIELVLLLLVYIVLLTISYHTSFKKNLLCPQIGFLLGFFLQACYAFGWVETWDLYLSDTTFFALSIGTTVYTVTCVIVQRFSLMTSYNNQTLINKINSFSKEIIVEEWKLVLFAIIQAITLIGCIVYLRSLTHGDFSQAIYYYHKAAAIDTSVRLPRLIGGLRTFTKPAGYFWLYILLHGIIYKYNNHKILLITNIVLSFFINIILGGRGGAIGMLLAAIVMAYIILQFKYAWTYEIKPSTLIKGISIVAGIAFLFPITGNLIGRPIAQSANEYIAIYLSAELKNLDTFISGGRFGEGNSLYTTQTLVSLVNSLSGHFGLPNWQHEAINQYRSINGHTLGNVSTTFYAFLYDGGFFTLIIYTIIMATITSVVFNRIYKRSRSKIDMGIIIYSYIFYDIAFSFFGDKFYDLVISKNFLFTIISFFCMKFLVNLKLKVRQ